MTMDYAVHSLKDKLNEYVLKINKAYKNGTLQLNDAMKAMSQIRSYLDNSKRLSDPDLADLLDALVGFFSITVDLPIDSLECLRVRPGIGFNHTSDVSYVHCTTDNSPAVGRFNKEGESLFYACGIYMKNDLALQTALSECKANINDEYSVLHSESKNATEFNFRIIGFWDYITSDKCPDWLESGILKECQQIYQCAPFIPVVRKIFGNVDEFLFNLATRNEDVKLYKTTNIIKEILFDDSKIDGILYPSTKYHGAPNIVLKTKTVDEKLEHKFVTEIKIFNYVNGKYFYETKRKAVVADDETLLWCDYNA